jgi:heptosyltransferase-2
MRPEKILVRSVNWLGDAVMSMPALSRLREARPEAQVTILTPEKLADLWQPPAVDAVLTFTKEESLRQIARRLRAEQFDVGLILPFSFRSALELWLAGIPRRIGYAHRGRSLLLTQPLRKLPDIMEMRKRSAAEVRQIAHSTGPAHRRPVPPSSHHLYRYLNLVAALGADPTPQAPRLSLAESELAAAARRFGLERGRPDAPLFGMNPGAEYGRAKRWPEERFIAAAQEIQFRTGCRWVLFGGPADIELSCRIETAIQCEADRRRREAGRPPEKAVWNLAGITTLRELCAALKLCALLVTNDTGPMHVAAAVGTPVVAPFGSTSPELTGPGLPADNGHRLLISEASCSPCFLRECPIDMRCMNSISVQRVTQAILQLLAA